ncbi:MAG: nitric-oxide reductase large subunit [Armatimonadota bacterium]|nr:MAG: nitric-oxide reductase large subunit [Armatimonadota bacterium]
MRYTKLWLTLAVVLLASFAVLGYYGVEIYQQAPPLPQRVITSDGQVIFTRQQIQEGQNVWQSMGGQEVGSVWGHGAYVAPDWSADWLHREIVWMLNHLAQQQHGVTYAELSTEQQAALRELVKREVRTNTYNPQTGDLVVSPLRAQAIRAVGAHYAALFGDDMRLNSLRQAYAIPPNSVSNANHREALNAFFFWAAWACGTNRPGTNVTYTNNWPHEPLIDNEPTSAIVLWSIISVVALLAGVGSMVWYFAARRREEEDTTVPEENPLRALQLTPSMHATLKYFWTVVAMFLAQIVFGILTAHYSVEGLGFFGVPLAQYLPYAVVRTWHVQLGIFWIATAWLATGLFVAPAVSGYEPRFQKLGVNLLYIALLFIVVGSMAGQWLSIQQKMGLGTSFWFGHQGYEYVDLGRFWQILLLVGLFLWLGMVGRALLPALRARSDSRSLLALFLLSAVAIGSFYGAGLMWGRHTHLAMAEYWRWWVVHLWVEGFFEVFATAVIAFLFSRMELVKASTATSAALFTAATYLTGGIIGTMHHLYFTGTPTAVLAWGATFSALEVVPLVLVGFEAYENLKLSRARPWVQAFRLPILFFVGVAFWNMVGAGLFGFLINPPIALYYMQGLNTTPVHGHTALFGVYGLLGLGLMLFCLRAFTIEHQWNERILRFAFWAMNIGLALMVLLSLLPVGLLQAAASIDQGLWYARSAEFLQQPLLQTLRWLRTVGDSVFTIGALALAWFVAGLHTGWSLQPMEERVPPRETDMVFSK